MDWESLQGDFSSTLWLAQSYWIRNQNRSYEENNLLCYMRRFVAGARSRKHAMSKHVKPIHQKSVPSQLKWNDPNIILETFCDSDSAIKLVLVSQQKCVYGTVGAEMVYRYRQLHRVETSFIKLSRFSVPKFSLKLCHVSIKKSS